MQNHSAKEIKVVKLFGNNYLQLDNIVLTRKSPSFPSDKFAEMHFKFQNTEVPLIEKLNENTAIMRIPSFGSSEKNKIDSLLTSNRQMITSTENLIIDLRNNGGGSDMSFQGLLPFLYTNPVREVGVEYLSTPLNNQRMEEFMSDPDFSEEDKKWAKKALEKLNQNLGSFVDVEDSSLTVAVFDTIYKLPKNIGIIINEGNGSTTEQFLLAAKQSKKVKLFGTTTAGVLDISNMYFVNSPCGDFKLAYCLTKSKRIPDFTIDEKGIQPDYYLDKSIPEFDWIPFVSNVLSN